MLTCSNCSVDISQVEIIERTAKSGKNIGNKYRAKVCPSCGTFNFITENSSNADLPNEVLLHLKRIETKVEQILLIVGGSIKVQFNNEGNPTIKEEDINWGETEMEDGKKHD